MILVVGLGNPGIQYRFTRHNIGFLALEHIISYLNNEKQHIFSINKLFFKGMAWKMKESIFLQPTTFMNLSGESVVAVAHYYNCEQIIVIHDDIDLNFGAIRFKVGGGNGGHKGLLSIDSLLKKPYHKIRIGISKPTYKNIDIADYVLSPFSEEELLQLQNIFAQTTKALISILQGTSWEKIASLFSSKGI